LEFSTVKVYQFPPWPYNGICGLFFRMPDRWQIERIRELARTLSADSVSTIVRRRHRETAAIIEGRP
jgi:hypothetical protein